MNALILLLAFTQTHAGGNDLQGFSCPIDSRVLTRKAETIPAEQYGAPDCGQVMTLYDYTLGFDGALRYARWTLERLDRSSLVDSVDRDGESFRIDERIDKEFRPRSESFDHSGYDKGHLACAANHRRSRAALRDTFLLENAAPQLPGFNRGCWKQLEEAVRRQALLPDVQCVFVLTGPLFIPVNNRVQYQTIGPNDTPVPTHFYKSLLILMKDGELQARTYVLPHSEWQARGSVLEAFDKYRVSVDRLESWAGFNAWSLLGDSEDELEKQP